MSGSINGNFNGRYDNGNALQREKNKKSAKNFSLQDPKKDFARSVNVLFYDLNSKYLKDGDVKNVSIKNNKIT